MEWLTAQRTPTGIALNPRLMEHEFLDMAPTLAHEAAHAFDLSRNPSSFVGSHLAEVVPAEKAMSRAARIAKVESLLQGALSDETKAELLSAEKLYRSSRNEALALRAGTTAHKALERMRAAGLVGKGPLKGPGRINTRSVLGRAGLPVLIGMMVLPSILRAIKEARGDDRET